MQNFSKTQEFAKKSLENRQKPQFSGISANLLLPVNCAKTSLSRDTSLFLLIWFVWNRANFWWKPGKCLTSEMLNAGELFFLWGWVFSLSFQFLEFCRPWFFFGCAQKKSLYYIQCPSMNLENNSLDWRSFLLLVMVWWDYVVAAPGGVGLLQDSSVSNGTRKLF